MGLSDKINTLEAREQAGQDVSNELALAYAEMTIRKSARRGVEYYFQLLKDTMKKCGRYQELVRAAGGVDPSNIGVWDCQAAVELWYQKR